MEQGVSLETVMNCLRPMDLSCLTIHAKKRLAKTIDSVHVPSFGTWEKYTQNQDRGKWLRGEEYLSIDQKGLYQNITQRLILARLARDAGVKPQAFTGRLLEDFYVLATGRVGAGMVSDMLSIARTDDYRALVVCKAFNTMQDTYCSDQKQTILGALQAAKLEVITTPEFALKETKRQAKLIAAVKDIRDYGFLPFW